MFTGKRQSRKVSAMLSLASTMGRNFLGGASTSLGVFRGALVASGKLRYEELSRRGLHSASSDCAAAQDGGYLGTGSNKSDRQRETRCAAMTLFDWHVSTYHLTIELPSHTTIQAEQSPLLSSHTCCVGWWSSSTGSSVLWCK